MIAYCCIAPHGAEIIPRLASRRELKRFEPTRVAMRRLGESVRTARPDTIVVATPHNLRVLGKIGVVVAENSYGTLRESRREVSLKAHCDLKFAKKLLRRASSAALPVVGANYGTAEGPSSEMPMDWGTLVPLWFLLKENRLKSKIVIVTPSREIQLARNFEFGLVLGDLAERDEKRIVFVASADQAHAHKKEGPYGFSPSASVYDRLVVEAVERNQLKSLLDLPPRLVREAKPDSLWQMAMLAGVLERVEMKSRFHSYQLPTYYGMLCAGFERSSES
jgi:aromatic ring-opening dioxygenase LigB subunit